jgi:DUF438 domain-containing protein
VGRRGCRQSAQTPYSPAQKNCFPLVNSCRFVHIRYFAVRDAQRNYMGTLEVTQDITGIRALEGERRLLQY